MTKRTAFAVLLALMLASAGLPARAAQGGLVTDGGYETPNDAAEVTTYSPGQSIGAWKVGSGPVDHVRNSGWGAPAEGNFWVDLTAASAGSVYQDIDTTSGTTYTMTFSLAGNVGNGPAVKTMDLYWAGSKVKSYTFDITGHTPSSMGWRTETVQLTASGNTSRLEFRSTTDGNAGPALDQVSLAAGGTQPQGGIGVSSFDPGLGPLVAIGFDQDASDLFIYPEHGAQILEFTTTGSQVGSGIPVPPPNSTSNDIDLDFATESLSVGGTSVPSNELLVPNGDGGQTLYAIDKDDGTIDAQQHMPGASMTGGAQHPGRDSFFVLSYSEYLIREVDPDDGTESTSFPITPEGSPTFTTFYSDIDVDPTTGNIVLVSSTQNVIRLLSPTGEWLGDVDVYNEDDANDPLRIDQMSGVAIDDASREVWISSRSGKVFKLTDLWDHFSTAVPCESDPSAICGDDGDDEIQGTNGNDTIYGGGGNDVIDGGGGDDVIVGGPGDDVLSGDASSTFPSRQPAFLFSGWQEQPPAGADVLDGGDGNDVLDGNAGNDQLNGGTGTDTVLGSEGNDKIAGAAANDSVAGGAGADQVLGQGGNDDLDGNGGPDVLKGGGGVNEFNGGAGNDTCVLNNSKDHTTSCEKKKRNFKRNFLPAKYLRAG